VPTRKTLLAIAALAVLAVLPGSAPAQVSTPAPVDEDREAPLPEPARPPRTEGKGQALRPGDGTREGARQPEPGAPPATPPAEQALPDPAAANAPATLPAPQPPRAPEPPPLPAARPILPVTASSQSLFQHWAERRTALREQDPGRAAAAAAAVLQARRELAIENLDAFAFSEVRETNRSLEAGVVADALAHAELAVTLAPELADAHLALARARFARSPGELGPVLSALRDAVGAAFAEPHSRRAFFADLLIALFAAVLAATAVALVVLLMRSLRVFLHDFHHLPLLRGSASVQAGFLGLVLLVTPWAFGLGPLAFVLVALAAAWLYLSTAERLAMTAAVLVVAAGPWAAQEAVRSIAWTGTLAEAVHELEHGAPSEAEVAELAARASEGSSPAPLAAALGRQAKRRGDLGAATRWYAEALRADPRAAEVQVNLGNVLFLQGNLEGAKASYLEAVDHAAGDRTIQAAAHYDLSKLYLRTSDIERSSAARDRAEQEDGAFLRRFGADDDFSANRYLVDVPVPAAKELALAAGDGAPEAIRDAARSRLAGALPAWTWPWVPLSLILVLWGLLLLEPRLAPSRACERCGRPACRRCDGGGGGPLCGQCVNVYVKKGLVDPRDRLLKDAAVRRHEKVQQVVTRALAVGSGGGGHLYGGAPWKGLALVTTLLFLGFLVWFWRGLMPPPLPTPYLLAGKAAVAVPLAVVIYVVAVRDLFRRTGS
jgi:tetratricopeptide (TPR) repeat protein